VLKNFLNEDLVRLISEEKGEPNWMLELRLKALETFEKMPMPSWGPDLSELKLDDLNYYLRPKKIKQKTWEDVPSDVRQTFEKLNIPEHEKKFFSGVGAQYESEMVYHRLKDKWKKKGIVFLDIETGLKEHPDIFKEYFGSVISYSDNKFAALNTAVWSGGSFIYIPKGVKIDEPLQTYFRIESEKLGQFERTLIIVDDDAQMSYMEGCTAPVYSTNSLHAGVVEVIAKKNSRVRYSTIQNWSNNIYNLVTKRAVAHENATVEWIFGSIGSLVTMEYPSVILKERGAKTNIVSVSLANQKNKVQDSGGKAIHLAPETSSQIISKSISNNAGESIYRGLVHIAHGAKNCKSFVQCDSLILDEDSKADSFPIMDVQESDVKVSHEARVSCVEEDQIFYLMSRGLKFSEAQKFIINGFIEPFVQELPMEYAVELERLLDIETVGVES